MEKAYDEIKSLIGLNKLIIFTLTASMAFFIDNHEYKSLSESLVNIKAKELINLKSLLMNIEISKAIIFLFVFITSIYTHKSIVHFIAKTNSRSTSLRTSIENIIRNYKPNDSSNLTKRIEAQKYTETNYKKENSEINYAIKISELFHSVGFFLVFASFYCGLLDFAIGTTLILISFYFTIKHQVEVLKIVPKYIASDIILNNSSTEKSINKYLNI